MYYYLDGKVNLLLFSEYETGQLMSVNFLWLIVKSFINKISPVILALCKQLRLIMYLGDSDNWTTVFKSPVEKFLSLMFYYYYGALI